jgi:tRNA nucleotidyltransferase (CCA-adding enzyme)
VTGPDPSQPDQLLSAIRALPAAKPLLARLGDATGVHIVGGAVRDLLLGGRPSDLDLVVEGEAGDMAAALAGQVVSHDRFGTATVVLDGFTYDIASARRESYPHPGALPEVTPASLDEDLLRRDFTVNTAAIALAGDRAGELRAAPGALDDLVAGRLRILHERSFEDDPTRLLRLARYRSRLNFEVEAETSRLADQAVAAGALATLSGARLGAELRLLAREPDPIAALEALRERRLDQSIRPGFGLEDPELARRALELLPDDGRADLLVLAVAARRLPATELAELLDALAFDRAERDAIVQSATRADAAAVALRDSATASEVARALEGAGPELAALAGALGPVERATDWLTRDRHVRLEIDGADLLEAGVREGPAIGRGLRAALAAKIDGRISGRDAELAEALRGAR